MKHKLAKELKDAGFEWEEMNQLTISRKETFPTLSELIKACGKGLWSLVNAGEDWIAKNDKLKLAFAGKTPEEAVARLWLALNKKT